MATFLGAVFCLWQSFRAALGTLDPALWLPAVGSAEKQALESEKAALIDSLHDLRFEWQVGKLSDDDYAAQEQLLRKRTRAVIRSLDQTVEPYRDAAEDLVAQALDSKHTDEAPSSDG